MYICLFQSGVAYMRKLKAIVLAGILSVTCAFSVSAASGYVQIVGNTAYDSNGNSYTTVGNTTYSSEGTSYTQVGNYVYGSNGVSYTTIGNTTFDSNGGSYQAVGNNIFGSDGSHAQVVGNQIYYDEPDDQDQEQDGVFPYLY